MAGPRNSRDRWDFDAQRASLLSLLARGLAAGDFSGEGAPACHVIYLLPFTSAADPSALAAALEAAGYGVERRWEDGMSFVIATREVALQEGALWASERRAAELALAHGLAPRGRCICQPGAVPMPGSPQELLAMWDFEHQRLLSSALTQEHLEDGAAVRGAAVALGVRFDGVFEWSDFEALGRALKTAGFAALIRPSEDGYQPHLLAVRPGVTFGVETIWTVEHAATRIAIPHGFRPDGWEIVTPWPPRLRTRVGSFIRSFQVGPL